MSRKLDEYRLLGRSGLRVSPLTLGTMTFRAAPGWGTSDEDAARMVDIYVDRGGNFIDTANFYGGLGGAEEVLGQIVKGRRERLVISTKYSLSTRHGDANASGNHRKNMIQSVEDSLRRMGTDYIDLLYLHMWDDRTPAEEILRGFDDLVRQGKILYAGLSDTPAWEASRMQTIADLRGWTPFVALQISYSLIERTVERELIPMARKMGMGVAPWAPLGAGILTGKYSSADVGQWTGDLGTRKDINLATGSLTERNLSIAATVGEVAKEIGRSSAQVAVAWTLQDPAIVSPVLGARTIQQLEDNLAALEVELTLEQLAKLDAASAIPMGFPHEMLNGPSMDMMFGFVKVERRPAS